MCQYTASYSSEVFNPRSVYDEYLAKMRVDNPAIEPLGSMSQSESVMLRIKVHRSAMICQSYSPGVYESSANLSSSCWMEHTMRHMTELLLTISVGLTTGADLAHPSISSLCLTSFMSLVTQCATSFKVASRVASDHCKTWSLMPSCSAMDCTRSYKRSFVTGSA